MKVSSKSVMLKRKPGKVSKGKIQKKRDHDVTTLKKSAVLEFERQSTASSGEYWNKRREASHEKIPVHSVADPQKLVKHSKESFMKTRKEKKSKVLGNALDAFGHDGCSNKGKRAVPCLELSTTEIESGINAKNALGLDFKLLEGVCSGILDLMHRNVKTDVKTNLFASQPQPINLQLNVHKIPHTSNRIIRCTVPNTTLVSDPDICLIVPDLQRGRKRDATFAKYVEQYEEKLLDNGVKRIKHIIPFTQLRCEYSQFEMKRRLAHTYDLFLCDGRIHGHCFNFLGKVFEKAKKIPVPIEAMKKVDKKFVFSPTLQNEVEKAVRKVYLTLHSHGTSYSIPVGHSEFSKFQLADNVQAVWKVLEKEFPGGIKNVRAAYLKGPRTCAVPLYASLVPPKNVPVGKPKDVREPVEDELSTLPGRKVIVYPSGDVKVVDYRTPEDFEFAKLNPLLETKKGSRKRKSTNGKNSAGSCKHMKTMVPEGELQEEKVNDTDSDDDLKDVEAAEAAYLSHWSKSTTLKELGNEELDKTNTKKTKKKKVKRIAGGKTGISQSTQLKLPKKSKQIPKKSVLKNKSKIVA